MPKLIGLFGGTFDPIHQGHLALANTVMESLHCDEMRFIPSASPPHKSTPHVSAQDRATMVGLAIEDQPRFVLDAIELQRTGASYTIDTLIALRQRFPLDALCLVMGQDSYQHLATWHRWQELLDYAHLVIVHRAALASQLKPYPMHKTKLLPMDSATTAFQQQTHGLMTYLRKTPPALSSTEIRRRLAKNVTNSSEIPAKVFNYISKHRLYLV